jgi:hypothetical protein
MNRWRVGEDRGSKEMDGCPLTLPVEVGHPVMHMKEFTALSSEETEVVCLMQELELWVIAALGISLLEVLPR